MQLSPEGSFMLRPIVEHSSRLLRQIRLFFSSTTARRSLLTTPRSSGRRDGLLHNAAYLSITLHLLFLLLFPAPGASSEQISNQRIVLHSRIAEEVVVEPIEKEILEEPVEVPDATPQAQQELDPPQQVEASPPQISQPLSPLPDPQTPLDAPVPSSAKLDGDKISSLLEETRNEISRDLDRDRWLMLEVREKIRLSLSQLQQRKTRVSSGPGDASCLVGFHVDAEGWIFDITLRPAPGVQFDAFAVRDAIAILNPLTAPPAGVATPVELSLRVEFLD